MTCDGEELMKGPAKLHGFEWGMKKGGSVHKGPSPIPGVVAQEPGLSVTFLLDCGGRKKEFE